MHKKMTDLLLAMKEELFKRDQKIADLTKDCMRLQEKLQTFRASAGVPFVEQADQIRNLRKPW